VLGKSFDNGGFAMFRSLVAGSVLLGAVVAMSGTAIAQGGAEAPAAASREQYRETINSNTITVIGSGLTGGNIQMIDDIAVAVNDGDNLRVLPILGEGSSQNIRDILYLKGIDAGTVKLGSVEEYERDPLFSDLRNRLQYIAVLGIQEFHVVGNHNLTSIRDLAGKKVGAHGGAFVSIKDLFGRLKIEPASLEEANFFKGLEQIKTGELDALVRVTAMPMSNFNEKFDPKYHKVIPIPLEDLLIEEYLPGKLTHEAYPNVVPDGATVETVASPVALVAYAWQPGTDRYRRVAKFAEAFFSNFQKILASKNRHASWETVNLYAELPAWQRFPAAQEWLDKNKPTVSENAALEKFNNALATSAITGDGQDLRSELYAYLKREGGADIPPEALDNLFNHFLEWQRQAGQR
jgi:TRAP-type uncharacterized transport system substrate-binding protein